MTGAGSSTARLLNASVPSYGCHYHRRSRPLVLTTTRQSTKHTYAKGVLCTPSNTCIAYTHLPVNLCRISRVLPLSVPNRVPLPSITMNPYLRHSRTAQGDRKGSESVGKAINCKSTCAVRPHYSCKVLLSCTNSCCLFACSCHLPPWPPLCAILLFLVLMPLHPAALLCSFPQFTPPSHSQSVNTPPPTTLLPSSFNLVQHTIAPPPPPPFTTTTHLLSDSSSSESAAVWNLLSHMYSEVLMGLKGSKSMLTCYCC